MSTRAHIAVLISLMVNAVLFGIGAITVLSIDALNAHAAILLPVVVVLSFALAPFISWRLAPRLRLRHRRNDGQLRA